uniref:Uncharacterized protein n=1 Tax=viral metagenome TaxID=1070528 RepID=A0A6M3KUF6_9ZZZZ
MSFQGILKVNDGTISCVVDGKQYIFDTDHPSYGVLCEAIKERDVETFISNYDVKAFIGEGVEIRGDTIYYQGEVVHNTVCENILRSIKEGFDIIGTKKFLENLIENPSKHSVDELFSFLQIHHLTITDDGCFLAYKCVKEDYLDKFSGKYDNHPGAVMEMSRNQVDDNLNHACSHGFHVGALGYSGPDGWYYREGDRVIIVKVNPKDVVCVPTDSNFQKVRVCRYEVVGDFQGELNRARYSGKVGGDYSSKKEEVKPRISIQPQDMLVDHYYEFDYTNKDGERKHRYVIVVEHQEDRVVCELIIPEEYHGECRGFIRNKMENILELMDEDILELENDYYEAKAYDEEDEEDDNSYNWPF